MPITLVDDDGNDIDIDKADGGTLRKKLEEALKENRDLAQRVVTSEAEKAIREHGYNLVKPEDLEGVSPSEVTARAKALHEERAAQREDMVRTVFSERGLEGDDLDAAVQDFLGGEGQTPPQGGSEESAPSFTGLEGLGGSRPPARRLDVPAIEDGFGNLTAHFAEQESKRQR